MLILLLKCITSTNYVGIFKFRRFPQLGVLLIFKNIYFEINPSICTPMVSIPWNYLYVTSYKNLKCRHKKE